MNLNHCQEARQALAKYLSDGLILIQGGKPVVRNFDVEYPFRQKSDFLYLTGFEEPGAWLLIDPKRKKETLFIPKADDHHRVWIGELPSLEESRKRYGFLEARYHTDLAPVLKKARAGYSKVYAEAEAKKDLNGSLKLPISPAPLRDALDSLRAVKFKGELELLKRASQVSSKAHIQVIRGARPGQYEYQLQAAFESECLNAGLRFLGYPSIVAAGENAAVLHYGKNTAKIKSGELVLIDAGAECGGYSADITRTFPINGKFTAQQKDIYSIVLETQKRSIERSLAGALSADLHVGSMRLIAEGLKSLGLLKGDTDGLVESGAVKVFYPHGLTHMLGLDVHDVTGGKGRRLPNPTKVAVRFVAKLEPGFVITMEPGIYFIRFLIENQKTRRKYRSQIDFKKAERFLDFGGVRIEDDIVIQPHGPPLNLTRVPKEIEDIERLMS